MQAVTVTNMRDNPVDILGLGTVNPGTSKSGFIETETFDADFYAYKDRCPAFGILIQDPNGSFTPAGLVVVTEAATLDATARVVSASNVTPDEGEAAPYVLTLMAAADVPAGTTVYFTYAGGDDDVTITRAGSDKIGTANTIALNAANPMRRLQSDGASLWTVV